MRIRMSDPLDPTPAPKAHGGSLAPEMRLDHRLHLERRSERRRLTRELHDELGQHLTAMQLTLASLLHDAQPGKLHELATLVEQATASLRRVMGDQPPALLSDHGPSAALRALGRDASRSLGINLSVRVYGSEPAVSPELSLALYRIAQEGLTNVARHARAGSVHMRLRWHPEHVTLTLEDDGVGLPEAALAGSPGCGLRGMRERAAAHGGRLELGQRRGGGTSLRATLPLRATGAPT